MFVNAPLIKFTSMFDLKVKKGWFPHAFNTAENEGYEGEISDVKCFDKKLHAKRNSKNGTPN